MSRDELDRTIPVTPPVVKRRMKPRAHSIGGLFIGGRLPAKVASQLKTLMPVGTAIIMVAAVKYARVSTSIPTVNMWWAQTMKPSVPIPIMA